MSVLLIEIILIYSLYFDVFQLPFKGSIREEIYNNLNIDWMIGEQTKRIYKQIYIHLNSTFEPDTSIVLDQLDSKEDHHKLASIAFEVDKIEPSVNMAKNVGFSIANSPLFKTAIAGEDPNWGRIAMAIGKSKESIIQNKLQIKIGEYLVAENGKVAKDYNESELKEYMKWESISIEVNLNIGSASNTVYTCDFTHDYIDINADYRN